MTFPAVGLQRPATMADLEALPATMKGELIDGMLYAMTRPRAVHQIIPGAVCTDLTPPFQRGNGCLWEIDREARTLIVLELEHGRWVDLGSYQDETDAHLPLFDAVPLGVRVWWQEDPALATAG